MRLMKKGSIKIEKDVESEGKLIKLGLFHQFLNFVAEGKTLSEIEQYAQKQIETILTPYFE
jgi:hypothetical protein